MDPGDCPTRDSEPMVCYFCGGCRHEDHTHCADDA